MVAAQRCALLVSGPPGPLEPFGTLGVLPPQGSLGSALLVTAPVVV
jgi:hypothetical protein